MSLFDPPVAEFTSYIFLKVLGRGDLQATLLHCLGFDHTRLTYKHMGREFRLTDVKRERREEVTRLVRDRGAGHHDEGVLGFIDARASLHQKNPYQILLSIHPAVRPKGAAVPVRSNRPQIQAGLLADFPGETEAGTGVVACLQVAGMERGHQVDRGARQRRLPRWTPPLSTIW